MAGKVFGLSQDSAIVNEKDNSGLFRVPVPVWICVGRIVQQKLQPNLAFKRVLQ